MAQLATWVSMGPTMTLAGSVLGMFMEYSFLYVKVWLQRSQRVRWEVSSHDFKLK